MKQSRTVPLNSQATSTFTEYSLILDNYTRSEHQSQALFFLGSKNPQVVRVGVRERAK